MSEDVHHCSICNGTDMFEVDGTFAGYPIIKCKDCGNRQLKVLCPNCKRDLIVCTVRPPPDALVCPDCLYVKDRKIDMVCLSGGYCWRKCKLPHPYCKECRHFRIITPKGMEAVDGSS